MPRPVARTPGNHEPASTTGLGSGLPAELASAEPRQVREHSPADSPPTASTSASLTPGPRPTRSRPTGRRAGRNRPRARGALRTSRRSGATLRPARRASAMCAGNTCRPTQASARVSICVRATLTRARALVARTNVRARTRARIRRRRLGTAHARLAETPGGHDECDGRAAQICASSRKPEVSPGVPVLVENPRTFISAAPGRRWPLAAQPRADSAAPRNVCRRAQPACRAAAAARSRARTPSHERDRLSAAPRRRPRKSGRSTDGRRARRCRAGDAVVWP